MSQFQGFLSFFFLFFFFSVSHAQGELYNCTGSCPPSAICLNPGQSYVTPGSCCEGACIATTLGCEFGCDNSTGFCKSACNISQCLAQTAPPTCISPDALLTYENVICNATTNLCQSTPVVTLCTLGCESGSCLPCSSEACLPFTPPPTCVEGKVVQLYKSVCVGNSTCVSETDGIIRCDHGCKNGECITCNATECALSAPQPICVNGVELTYTGVCSINSTCEIITTATPCTFGCSGQACAACNLTDCISMLPPPICLDGSTFSYMSTCVNNVCVNIPALNACTFRCASGECLGCSSSFCSSHAPPPTCHGDILEVSVSLGCVNNECDIKIIQEKCPSGCERGKCVTERKKCLEECPDIEMFEETIQGF